jgi:hypothetical protein
VTNSKHPRVGGNQLYVICTVCGPDIAQSLRLAHREDGPYGHFADRRDLDKFFETHAKCGGTYDHYKMAMGHEANYDAVEFVDPATNIAGAVRLSLVKS